jgi:hypothetical protein
MVHITLPYQKLKYSLININTACRELSSIDLLTGMGVIASLLPRGESLLFQETPTITVGAQGTIKLLLTEYPVTRSVLLYRTASEIMIPSTKMMESRSSLYQDINAVLKVRIKDRLKEQKTGYIYLCFCFCFCFVVVVLLSFHLSLVNN